MLSPPLVAHDLREFFAHQRQRLIPGRFAEFTRPAAADQGRFEAAGMGRVIGPETAFDAQIAIVRGGIKRRADPVNHVVLDMQIHLAAYTAVGAGGANDAIRCKWRCVMGYAPKFSILFSLSNCSIV